MQGAGEEGEMEGGAERAEEWSSQERFTRQGRFCSQERLFLAAFEATNVAAEAMMDVLANKVTSVYPVPTSVCTY